MYKIFKALVYIIWVLDIINIPQLQILDTTIPINEWAWLLIFLVLPSSEHK